MKKGCIYSLLLTVLTGQAVAQTVSVADVEAKPGETVSATLEFNAPADTYTGVQFAVQFPALGYSMATNGAVSGWNGSIEYGSMTEGKVKFAAAASKTYETGTIAVEFTVATSVAYGEYDVTVTDIQFEGAGIKTGADDVTFKVSVVSAHNVLIDEASITAPTSATGVNVRVKRTIKANEWSTICLPFDMTEAQVKAAFGDDVQLAEFKGWETTEFDDDDNATAISVSFGDVNAIAANTPYIIKVSKAITEFTADDVDIDPEDEPAVTVGRINRGTFGSFTGSYVPMTIEEGNLFLSDGKFWYSTGKTAMKGYRAYFYFQDVLASYSNSAATTRISMRFADGTTTSIGKIDNERLTIENDTYDLHGRKIEKPVRKGLYIRGGKKVVRL